MNQVSSRLKILTSSKDQCFGSGTVFDDLLNPDPYSDYGILDTITLHVKRIPVPVPVEIRNTTDIAKKMVLDQT